MANVVTNNQARNRYELASGRHVSFIEYRREGSVVTMVHTEVPDALSGQGQGSLLVRGALDMVRAEGLKVIASCPFVAAYIKRHAQYQDLLV